MDPNLAIVCDAEQIIRASIDRKDGNRITYMSGPIEDFDINERPWTSWRVLDLLSITEV